MSGALIGLACGLILDLFFSGTIGLYALPYFVVGALAYFISKNLRYVDKFLMPVIFAVGGYIVKEVISSLLVYMLGVEFSFIYMFIRFMLPKALFTGALMLLIHFLFTRLYRFSSMKIKSDSDFKHL